MVKWKRYGEAADFAREELSLPIKLSGLCRDDVDVVDPSISSLIYKHGRSMKAVQACGLWRWYSILT